MALSNLLLLQALFFSLLLLMVPSQCQVDTAPTRPAMTQATSALCGKTGSVVHRKILCTKFPELADERPQALSETLWETMHKGSIIIIVFGILFCLVSFIANAETLKEDSVPLDNNSPAPSNAVGTNSPDKLQSFSFNEIRTITNRFGLCLGEGGFGKVYQGELPNGCKVAVKLPLEGLNDEVERVFNAERAALSKTRHQNVVKLIGTCTESNRRVLVYELLPKKDLYNHLQPKKKKKKSELYYSWKLRVKVLLDAARGIEYLHKNAKPRIIQRDVKSQNILIDEKWVAKISDFGLAVFGPEAGSDSVKIEMPAGTMEYLDPEYLEDNTRATPRNDVYSFGVVMLEVITGKKPGLVGDSVPQINSDPIEEVCDSRLPVPEGCELKALTIVAQLATQCVKVPGVDRPDMTVVVTKLESALQLFHQGEASAS